MKKIITVFVILVMGALLLSACGSKQDSSIKKEVYKDDYALFYSQDRCDVEDDRFKFYTYNYKGEFLGNELKFCASDDHLVIGVDQNTGLSGFTNTEGEFVIDPIYEDVGPFSKQGLAKVCDEDGKIGFINEKGEEVIPLIYDMASGFYDNGYAIVSVYAGDTQYKYGVIDTKGNVVIDIAYNYISYLLDNYALCSLGDGKTQIVDYKGNILEESDEDNFFDLQTFGYGDVRICEFKYSSDGENSTIESLGYYNGKEFIKEKEKYEISSKKVSTTLTGEGYGLSVKGKTVIPYIYDEIIKYNNYFVGIKYEKKDGSEQKIDIYDSKFNKTAENLEYLFGNRFSYTGARNCYLPDGYFLIRIENEDYDYVMGVIDYKGNIIVEPKYGRYIGLNTYQAIGLAID